MQDESAITSDLLLKKQQVVMQRDCFVTKKKVISLIRNNLNEFVVISFC